MSIAFIVRNVLRLDTFSCAFEYDHQQATGVVGHERDTIATRSFVFMSDALGLLCARAERALQMAFPLARTAGRSAKS